MERFCFSDDQEAQRASRHGIPVMVELYVEDFYAHGQDNHADNYLRMLGFERKDKDKTCTILGELGNMRGHYVVVGKNGKIVSGLHGDIFYLPFDKEDFD